MTDKRLKTELAFAMVYGMGITARQAASAMRKFINALPTVTQAMKNFALQARNVRKGK